MPPISMMSPLRPWRDFLIPGRRGLGLPYIFQDCRERFISNLLYYQTNYLIVITAITIIDGFVAPVPIIIGSAQLLGFLLVFCLAGEIQPLVSLKRWSPFAFFYAMLFIYEWLTAYGVAFNLANPTFAKSCRFSRLVMIIHAAIRDRNLDEREYHREAEELRGTPMGILLIGRVKKDNKTN